MTIEQIEKFIDTETVPENKTMKIDFRKRNSIRGFIIKGTDYADLKSKNLWRIVFRENIDNWNRSKNVEFAKIFSGTEFTRLSMVSVKEEV